MSDFDKVDELIKELILDMPTLNDGHYLIEGYIRSFDNTFNLQNFKSQLIDSYKLFEEWLNELFIKEDVQDNIVAFYFGLYESEAGIQLYLSGSTEWEADNEDWASINEFFPERRPNIPIYEQLDKFSKDNLYLELFLSLSTTIIYANTYLFSCPLKFPRNIVLATGFDDGDLYNFAKKYDENITSFFN